MTAQVLDLFALRMSWLFMYFKLNTKLFPNLIRNLKRRNLNLILWSIRCCRSIYNKYTVNSISENLETINKYEKYSKENIYKSNIFSKFISKIKFEEETNTTNLTLYLFSLGKDSSEIRRRAQTINHCWNILSKIKQNFYIWTRMVYFTPSLKYFTDYSCHGQQYIKRNHLHRLWCLLQQEHFCILYASDVSLYLEHVCTLGSIFGASATPFNKVTGVIYLLRCLRLCVCNSDAPHLSLR